MNKLDINKQYRTVSGNKAEILKTGVANFYWSVAALISDENGIQYLMTYQDDGRVRSDGHPDRNDLVENSPYEDFKIDEPVMVRDFDTEPWNRRHFAGVDAYGRAKAWDAGSTSWTVDNVGDYATWDKCRRPTPEELAGPIKA